MSLKRLRRVRGSSMYSCLIVTLRSALLNEIRTSFSGVGRKLRSVSLLGTVSDFETIPFASAPSKLFLGASMATINVPESLLIPA